MARQTDLDESLRVLFNTFALIRQEKEGEKGLMAKQAK